MTRVSKSEIGRKPDKKRTASPPRVSSAGSHVLHDEKTTFTTEIELLAAKQNENKIQAHLQEQIKRERKTIEATARLMVEDVIKTAEDDAVAEVVAKVIAGEVETKVVHDIAVAIKKAAEQEEAARLRAEEEEAEALALAEQRMAAEQEEAARLRAEEISARLQVEEDVRASAAAEILQVEREEKDMVNLDRKSAEGVEIAGSKMEADREERIKEEASRLQAERGTEGLAEQEASREREVEALKTREPIIISDMERWNDIIVWVFIFFPLLIFYIKFLYIHIFFA